MERVLLYGGPFDGMEGKAPVTISKMTPFALVMKLGEEIGLCPIKDDQDLPAGAGGALYRQIETDEDRFEFLRWIGPPDASVVVDALGALINQFNSALNGLVEDTENPKASPIDVAFSLAGTEVLRTVLVALWVVVSPDFGGAVNDLHETLSQLESPPG